MSDVRLVATNPDDGTLVPVASNSSGQLAVQSPSVEKVPNDLDVEGDLSVTGSADFAGDVEVSTLSAFRGSTNEPTIASGDVNKTLSAYFTSQGELLIGGTLAGATGTDQPNVRLNGVNGSAIFKGDIEIGGGYASGGGCNLFVNNFGTSDERGAFVARGRATMSEAAKGGGAFVVSNTNRTPVIIDYIGNAKFEGDVIVGSRNSNWMLVEQGGLCHMVEQTRTADLIDEGFVVDTQNKEYPKLRDVFKELDLIEQALNTVMEKLRLTPPAGWEVWDGSDNL